jgi:hypothetical protein
MLTLTSGQRLVLFDEVFMLGLFACFQPRIQTISVRSAAVKFGVASSSLSSDMRLAVKMPYLAAEDYEFGEMRDLS